MSTDWSDLRARTFSAIAMIAVGGGAIWAGGSLIVTLAVLVSGLMIWELARLCGVDEMRARIMGAVSALAAIVLVLVPFVAPIFGPVSLLALFIPAGIGMRLVSRGSRGIFGLYSVMVMLTGYGLVGLRITLGIEAVVWLLGVVILSDIGGYFAGRMIGGPKFWPKISPKKTWSGTVAGWVCAAIWGGAFGGISLAVMSVAVSFAGQLGDILESWLKRRAGIKDSSNLIPGHGGVLDRFDALVGAITLIFLLVVVFGLFNISLPIPVGIKGTMD